MNRVYAHFPVYALVYALAPRERKLPPHSDGLETGFGFESVGTLSFFTLSSLSHFNFSIIMMSALEVRKPARKLNYRKRCFALTADEVVKLKRLKKNIAIHALKAKLDTDNHDYHSFYPILL